MTGRLDGTNLSRPHVAASGYRSTTTDAAIRQRACEYDVQQEVCPMSILLPFSH